MANLPSVYLCTSFRSSTELPVCRAQGDPRVGGANGFNRRSGGVRVNRSPQQPEDGLKCWTYTIDSNIDES